MWTSYLITCFIWDFRSMSLCRSGNQPFLAVRFNYFYKDRFLEMQNKACSKMWCLLRYIAAGVHLCKQIFIAGKWASNITWDIWTRVYFGPRSEQTLPCFVEPRLSVSEMSSVQEFPGVVEWHQWSSSCSSQWLDGHAWICVWADSHSIRSSNSWIITISESLAYIWTVLDILTLITRNTV